MLSPKRGLSRSLVFRAPIKILSRFPGVLGIVLCEKLEARLGANCPSKLLWGIEGRCIGPEVCRSHVVTRKDAVLVMVREGRKALGGVFKTVRGTRNVLNVLVQNFWVPYILHFEPSLDAFSLRSNVINSKKILSPESVSGGRHEFPNLLDSPLPLAAFESNPGGDPGANLESISHSCHPNLVAFIRELTKENISLPLGCL